jgi:predicted transport protein
MPKTLTLQELESHLWGAANILRGSIDSSDYKHYFAYRKIKNLFCLEIRPSKKLITLFCKLDPDTVELKEGFTRDVRSIGHYGTGDLEITLTGTESLTKATPLLQKC